MGVIGFSAAVSLGGASLVFVSLVVVGFGRAMFKGW
jgi:hypothetical protein